METRPVKSSGRIELASQVLVIVHSNKQLLINRDVSSLVRQQYVPDGDSGLKQLSVDDFHALVTTMVTRGFKINRLKDIGPHADTSSWNYMHYFDALIDRHDSTTIRVSYNTEYQQLNEKFEKENLNKMHSMVQDGLFYELGIVFPSVEWNIDEDLEDNEFQIQINDVNEPKVDALTTREFLVNDTVDRLTLLSVEGKEAINPANGAECAIIDQSDVEACENAGLTTWNALGYLILHLSSRLRKQAGTFLNRYVVENNLASFRKAFPALVDVVLSRYDKLQLTWILRDLLDEEICIRDLRNILDNLSIINGLANMDLGKYIYLAPRGSHLVVSENKKMEELEVSEYSNYIRASALKRQISHKYTRGGNTLVVYLLDPEIEREVAALKGKAMPEAKRDEIINAVYEEVHNLPPTAQSPVILTAWDIRWQFRKLIEVEFPHLAVLSYQELAPDINVQPIARISLD
jgi:type III secretion protein V